MSEYVGLDVSKEETSYCVMDREGRILARGIPNGRVGPSGKQLAEHALWFWSYRATLSDHSKKA